MPEAVCPKCGVAVVAGYVRCPKCHANLPRRRTTSAPVMGGTALPTRRSPLVPIVVGVLAFGGLLALYFALRGNSGANAAPGEVASPAAPRPAGPAAPAAAGPAAQPAAPTPAAAPVMSAEKLAAELDRTLKHQQLWSTVEVVGDHVDIRSSSCKEAALAATVDRAGAGLKAAGMRRLRCLEASGTVVFQREL